MTETDVNFWPLNFFPIAVGYISQTVLPEGNQNICISSRAIDDEQINEV
jgi:hypothetical protein